jgi:CelD/BcsL family acetyltransferase involved in cellulose biosynthesis
MKINIISATQLSADHISAWSRLQQADPALANPFYRPEFTQAVAAERRGVDVAVLEKGGEPVGFLPFERSRWGAGQAVGASINQFQGAIVRRDLNWDPRSVVRAAGLRSWRFDHLLASQTAFARYQYITVDSPFLDLSQGFEHYRRSRGKSAAKFVSHVFQKDRKAGRDLGEVRLEVSPADRSALNRLIGWKIEQCRQRHLPCVYDLEWMVRVHERLLECSTNEFSGMLFNLYVADRPAAGFFCLRSGSLLQGSILGYDRELSPYAPGFVILMRVAQMVNSLGIMRIDMGKGDDSYKQNIASGCEQVMEGNVVARAALAPFYRGWMHVRDRLRTTPLRGLVRRVRRWTMLSEGRVGYSE